MPGSLERIQSAFALGDSRNAMRDIRRFLLSALPARSTFSHFSVTSLTSSHTAWIFPKKNADYYLTTIEQLQKINLKMKLK
jgi:hypothetical protein